MQQQKQFKVLLIGDSCVDKYVYGSVNRLNPEAPVPILDFSKTEIRKGMAWNVYSNLSSFGLDITMLTNKESITKTRYIDKKSNQQILRVDEECDIKPLDDDTPLEGFDVLVISDYDKGFVTSKKIFELVESFDGPVFIDSKKTDLPVDNAYIKINDLEYSKLKNKNNPNLIITRGSKGTEFRGKMYPAKDVDVFDVVGAGDTFLSTLVYFYLKYGIIEKAIPFANNAAAISVSHTGTYVLTGEDINALCN
jgi:D-beta-D-heptose 7-phosphate kinase/D-beta-D-heptose 1-phosphate adenosyltransferase